MVLPDAAGGVACDYLGLKVREWKAAMRGTSLGVSGIDLRWGELARGVTSVQFRAVRLILDLTRGQLADAKKVGRATINRFEIGVTVGEEQVSSMRHAIEAAGAVLIPDGTVVDEVTVYGNVGMRSPTRTGRPDDAAD